jgi:hypothetical protein
VAPPSTNCLSFEWPSAAMIASTSRKRYDIPDRCGRCGYRMPGQGEQDLIDGHTFSLASVLRGQLLLASTLINQMRRRRIEAGQLRSGFEWRF